MALSARADVFPYEGVSSAGRNNTVDSNAQSCDATEGCYTNTGARCSLNPNTLCNLQIVPAGRCTYGDLSTGLSSCVWPHRAGHCSGNVKVGCLTNAQCTDAGGTCLLTTDIFGAAYAPTACNCQGTNSAGADFETVICGGSLSVCSDGDPTRDVGGLGTALGVELKLGGVGSQTFAGMGPSITGSSRPDSTPGYAIENPPQNFDPQRDAGSIARGPAQGTGPIHPVRGTDAREITAYVHPTIATPVNVRKVVSFGDSQYADWAFLSVAVTGTFNTHIVTYPCDPPVGWVVGTPVTGGLYCHQAARDGISFLWDTDLTPAQVTAYTSGGQRICPPNCNKDFNISTYELEELNQAGAQDPNAGIQLAMQSGEEAVGRQAGERDSIGVAAVTSITFLIDNDLRCRIGGWGSPVGEIGRCVDGARTCVPGAAGDAACQVAPSQGASCRACVGPITVGNPLGVPIGYNTHGRPELDLVTGQRIGGIAGQNGDVRVPLFVVGTTGNATSDFRDLANEGLPAVDLSDMGPVDPLGPVPVPGIGAGGTFTNGTQLNIAEPCCTVAGVGANVSWDAETAIDVQTGFENGFSYTTPTTTFLSDWALVYDKGPGPDGIPGCIGDNVATLNGSTACDQRLGVGSAGAKTDGFFATGKDDRALEYVIGASTVPAVSPRFSDFRDASAAVVAQFPGTTQNPPTVNTVAAFTARDLNVFVNRSADILVKVNTVQCPLTATGAVCTPAVVVNPCAGLGDDTDGDGICGNVDNCPTVANPGQENGGTGGETGGPAFDGVGNACDNCTNANNPRVPGWTLATGSATYLAANQWATLSGGQRDDDDDGYGNFCDGDFNQSNSTTAVDTAQYKPSIGDAKAADICGTAGTRPCAIFDLNSANSTESSAGGISAADTARYKLLVGSAPGPRCPTCPLTCEAGTAGACVP